MNRSCYIDNIKGLLMLTVVFTHILLTYKTTPILGGVINVVYSFHMPAFILISGYLSKRVETHRRKELDTLLWPFVVFQILYFIYSRTTGVYGVSINLFSPIYLNWYIIALFIWRLILPYFKYYNKQLVIMGLIGLSFIAGAFINNTFLSMYRAFYYFPLFAIGYYINDLDSLVQRLSSFKWLFVVGFVIGVITIFYLSYSNDYFNSTINYALTPDQNYQGKLMNIIIRTCGFATTVLMTFFFIVTCYSIRTLSKRLFLISDSGRNSISVYYIHGFVALFVTANIGGLSLLGQFITASILTFILCWLLSRDITVRYLKPLFDFNNTPKSLRKIVYGSI